MEQGSQLTGTSASGHSGGEGGDPDDLHGGVDGKGDDHRDEGASQEVSGESTLKEENQLGVDTDLFGGKVGEDVGLGGDSSGGTGGGGGASQ